MTKNKSTKRALLASLLSLVLCVTMLVGTTFAWFTDSVTSLGNVIKSGNLDVEMYWAEGKTDPADTTWIDASTGAIFNSKLWEPGYTEVRHIKIANVGSLALKYQLHIAANGDVSELADVIDVYFLDPAQTVADRTALAGLTPVGTLTEVLAGMPGNASGELSANESDVITLALKMRENAGNEYQNKEIGSDFIVQLLATQLTEEKDSFDEQYDAGAEFYEVDESVTVTNTNAKLDSETVLTADLPFGTLKVTVPAGAQLYSAEVSTLKLTVKKAESGYRGALTENQVALGYEIYVDGLADYINPYTYANGNKGYNYSKVTVELPIGAGRNDVSVYKDGFMPTNDWASYDSESGIVTFATGNFNPAFQAKVSNFTVVYTKLTEAEKLLNAAISELTNGGSVTVTSTADNTVSVNNLADALNGSENIVLVGEGKENTLLVANDATVTADGLTIKDMTIQAIQDTVINGDGTTVENVDYQHGIGSYGLTLAGSDTTIKNTTVSGKASQALVWFTSESDTASSVTSIEGTTITDVGQWGSSGGITFQNHYGTVEVTDCNISVQGSALQLGPNRGFVRGNVKVSDTNIDSTALSVSTVASSEFNKVTFDNTWNDSPIRFAVGGTTNTLTACEFKTDVNFVSANYGNKSVTLILNDCTYNGVAITAENITEHFAFDEATWGLNVRDKLTLIVNGTTVTL